jgi:hypothetical protein
MCRYLSGCLFAVMLGILVLAGHVGPAAIVLIDGGAAKKAEATFRVDASYAIVPVSTSKP